VSANAVLPKRQGPTEARFHHLLVIGLDRVADKVGKTALAEAMDRTVRALDDVLERGATPGAYALFNALLADPTALAEVLRAYGLKVVPDRADAANDLSTAAGLSHAAGALIEAHEDGYRNHSETLRIANRLRPLLPQIAAIIEEADRLKGAA
jgi:predicted N-formylglutamate amidohydrolase